MPIVANRFVSLAIAPTPTISDMIKAVSSPVGVSGTSVTFTIPNNVAEGDLLVIFFMDRSSPNSDMLDTGGWYTFAGAFTYVGAAGFELHDGNLQLLLAEKTATSSDAGSTVTFSSSAGRDLRHGIGFLVVVSGDHAVGMHEDYPDVIYNYSPSTNPFFPATPLRGTGFVTNVGASFNLEAGSLVFYVYAGDGDAPVSAQIGETLLCYHTNGMSTLFVAAKVNTLAITVPDYTFSASSADVPNVENTHSANIFGVFGTTRVA